MTSAGRKLGRPRHNESVDVNRSPVEVEIADAAMRHAQEHRVSFEKAFGAVGVTHPRFADVLPLSAQEQAVAEHVMRYAQEHSVSWETAFADVVVKRARASVPHVLPASDAAITAQPDVLSLGGAARSAHVSKSTLSRWLEKGDVQGRKSACGVWQISADQLEVIARLRREARPGKRVTPPVDAQKQDGALWERLVLSERARADAAEQRCDALVNLLTALVQRG